MLNFRDAIFLIVLYQYLFITYSKPTPSPGSYPILIQYLNIYTQYYWSYLVVSLFFWYHLVIPILIKEKELIMICLLIVFCVLQGRLFGTTNVMSYLKYKRNTKWYKICLCRSLQLSKIQGVPSRKQWLFILYKILPGHNYYLQ